MLCLNPSNLRLLAMKIQLCVKVALFSLTILSPIATLAQKEDVNVDLVYTGRLLGYFRVPSLQDYSATNGCPAAITRSKAAVAFDVLQTEIGKPKAILVGTGDNFAPQLEARVFSEPPDNGDKYAVGNKELYFGSNDGWVLYEKLHLDQYKELRENIAEGKGTIPNDNVACFLRNAGYAAIVPGKHDFYFGAERVRQFARFLATPAADKSGYHPVQMLGANLVIKTSPIESESVPASVIAKRPFEGWPTAYPILNLKDKGTVYPWFSVFKIQLIKIDNKTLLSRLETLVDKESDKKVIPLSGLDSLISSPPKELEEDKNFKELKTNRANLTTSPIRICTLKGNPNEEPPSDCADPGRFELRLNGNTLILYAYLKEKFKGIDNHFSTLAFGKNYLVCTRTIDPKNEKVLTNACSRFSVHTPFFYFPHIVPKENEDGYTDPAPYVVRNNVAIFGVVDPSLGEQVGILNFGWKQDVQKDLTSRVSVEDPEEALRQQLDYFEIQQSGFSGLKVLLAQMTPQSARGLAARFPDFQIVVSAADPDLATTNINVETDWKPNARAAGTFLAVPTPYFDPGLGKGTVNLGVINASRKEPEWHLIAKASPGKPVDSPDATTAAKLWKEISALPGCLDHFDVKQEKKTYDNKTYLKWLVLCSMQQHTGADAALIQTRDLFDQIPELDTKSDELLNRAKTLKKNEVPPENKQQMLDRLIWKGDLVTLLIVPGSALKKALEQSERYEAAEKASLSLSVDTGRKLETLGIRSEGGEYFINDMPLDDTRPYAVAVTDYIGAGDTGYPDLVKAARNPRTHPAAFTGDLVPISGLVCNKLFTNPSDMKKYCLKSVDSNKYLDTTTAKQTEPYKPQSRLAKLWKASGFAWPDKPTEAKSTEEAIELKVHRRSFWAFSLKNLSVGFKELDNNDTDESLSNKFGGIGLSGLTAKENRSIAIGLDTRLSRFADKQEVFFGLGIDYDRQRTGNPVTLTSISQNKNRLFSDVGVVLWRRPGRALPNAGVVLSAHAETQLERPFSSFQLNTGNDEDQIRIFRKRSLTLLARIGMRWQSRSNSFEIGGQWGREMRALKGYRFDNPDGSSFECLVASGRTLGKCIDDNSEPPDDPITMNSVGNALIQGRPRAGIYWNHAFSIPFGPKLKYEVTQDADFFFVTFARNTTVDTRFRYNAKNSVKWTIWPNFSIGPTLELLMFQNHKGFDPVLQEQTGRKFLFQRTFGIEAKVNFDIFNRREKLAQIISR
jgi:hypothetical protein